MFFLNTIVFISAIGGELLKKSAFCQIIKNWFYVQDFYKILTLFHTHTATIDDYLIIILRMDS
jgi:hypothetical protein